MNGKQIKTFDARRPGNNELKVKVGDRFLPPDEAINDWLRENFIKDFEIRVHPSDLGVIYTIVYTPPKMLSPEEQSDHRRFSVRP